MDHVVIDGPPRVANLLRSALFACDLALIPVQPSPLDGWASAEMLKLIDQARIFKPEIGARFLLNRYHARTLIARATAESLAEHDPPLLAHHVGTRVVFADAMQTGRLVPDIEPESAPARKKPHMADAADAPTSRHPP